MTLYERLVKTGAIEPQPPRPWPLTRSRWALLTRRVRAWMLWRN